MVKVFLILVLFTVSVVDSWLIQKTRSVKAVGRVTCDGQPMPNIYIELITQSLIFNNKIASARADSDGRFTVSANGVGGKPKAFVKVFYSYSGNYGHMKVVTPLNTLRSEETGAKSFSSSYIDFGTINFASVNCRAYNQFYKAMKDFKDRSKHSIPYNTLTVITNAILHDGVSYATTTTIRIPSSYNTVSDTTAKHEFAHTIRHSMDGNYLHFLWDVSRYEYIQHHYCDTRTNEGFAFNEGWAEYWAGSCYGNHGSSTDYKIEGNVANALRKLQKDCSSSYEKMVEVLYHKDNNIHSFQDYNNVHKQLFGCGLSSFAILVVQASTYVLPIFGLTNTINAGR